MVYGGTYSEIFRIDFENSIDIHQTPYRFGLFWRTMKYENWTKKERERAREIQTNKPNKHEQNVIYL